MIRRHGHDEAGQTMAEYAVVLGVITLALVLAFGVFSGSIATLLQNASSLIPG